MSFICFNESKFCVCRSASKTHRTSRFTLHRRADTYSFGVVISEVKSRKLPYADVPRNQKTGFNPPLIRAIKTGKKRPLNNQSWGAEIYDLVDRSTRQSPAERPPFGEVAGILKVLVEAANKESSGGGGGGGSGDSGGSATAADSAAAASGGGSGAGVGSVGASPPS